VEEHFTSNLKKELNKTLTKDDKFARKKWERTMDLIRRRLNLNKYLKEMAEKVEKFNENLKKIIKKLDNQNLLLKEIKKLKKLEEIRVNVIYLEF